MTVNSEEQRTWGHWLFLYEYTNSLTEFNQNILLYQISWYLKEFPEEQSMFNMEISNFPFETLQSKLVTYLTDFS